MKIFYSQYGKDNLDKFDSRSDEGIFLDHSSSRAYRIYNNHTFVVEESIHVVFIHTNHRFENISAKEEEISGVPKTIQVTKNDASKLIHEQTRLTTEESTNENHVQP